MIKLTPFVCKVCTYYDAWVVGGAALPGAKEIRDIDIVIPFEHWNQAVLLVPKDAVMNTFGGYKFLEGGIEIDVWPDNIGKLLTLSQFTNFWNPIKSLRWNKEL